MSSQLLNSSKSLVKLRKLKQKKGRSQQLSRKSRNKNKLPLNHQLRKLSNQLPLRIKNNLSNSKGNSHHRVKTLKAINNLLNQKNQRLLLSL